MLLLGCVWEPVGILLRGDDLDLYQSVLGQTGNFHSAAGRILAFGEEGGIHFVHGAEVVHVAEEHGGLENMVHGDAGLFQNGLHVGQGLAGLGLDALGERAGGGIDGQLAGSNDQAVELRRLGVGADGGGGFRCADDGFNFITFLSLSG